MNYTDTINFKDKTDKERFEDIYRRINKLENYMLGIKKDNKPEDINIVANLDLNKDKAMENIREVKEEIEDLRDLLDELELPDIRPIINFYGCSFNFANDGCAESRYYGGDDIYNPRKDVENEPVFPDGR